MDEQRETILQNAGHQGDIHAAVMAERERCAKIVEAVAGADKDEVRRNAAYAIRNQ